MSSNFGGILGLAVGFVILSYGIKILKSSSEFNHYSKRGFKIYPMSMYKSYRIKFPKIKVRI